MCKKWICLLLCGMILFLSACGNDNPLPEPSANEGTTENKLLFTRSPGRLQKREAVYVSMDPDGSVRQIDVTDRLISDVPEVRVEDVSSLRNIRSLTPDTALQSDGLNLIWHMRETQLYYTGTTEKELPIRLHIRYYLNNEETTLRAMRGKSGHFHMEIQAENGTGSGDRFTPFLLAGGMLLPQDAQQVQVTNGGSVGDGKHDIAFGVMLPGVGAALDIEPLRARIPSGFTIDFTAKRFSPGNMYFVAVPLRTDRFGELLGEVFAGENFEVPDLSGMMTKVRDAVQGESLQNAFEHLPESTALFRAASETMQAYARQAPLMEVLEKYLTAENAQMLRRSIEALSGTSLSSYASLVQDPVFISFVADLGTVSDAFLRLIPTLSAFIADLQKPEVLQAIETLPDTLDKLSALTGSIEANRETLNTLTDLSENGTFGKIAELSAALRSMVDSGTLETIQAMTGQAEDLRTHLQGLLDRGKEYGIFTLAPENAECSVYFVLKTQVD